MIKCRVLSTTEVLFSEEVAVIDLTTKVGNMQILPGHAELFAILASGDVVVTTATNQQKTISIDGGVCYFMADVAALLVHQLATSQAN